MKKAFLFRRLLAFKSRRGFTLMEILVAVVILTILITMSVPMYERAVEKSRVAEVSALLKRMSESKLRTMDSMNIMTFSNHFGISQLDVQIPASQDFYYSLAPSSYANAVCARRLRGDHAGTVFLYLGETAPEDCASSTGAICSEYKASGRKLFCRSKNNGDCEAYGLSSYATGDCN